MTIEEAIASGLFDMPDEPGMVRIPISINVMIPNHLLWPPQPPEERSSDYDDLDDTPPPMTAGGHAARKIAESVHTMVGPAEAEARASFRDMLQATRGGRSRATPVQAQAASAGQVMDLRRPDADRDHPSPAGRPETGLRTPDAAPIRLAGAQPEPPGEEERIGPEGRELDPAEVSNNAIYQNDVRELEALDPRNPALKMLRSPDQIPDAAAVARIEQALAEVRARAAGPAPAADPAPTSNPMSLDGLPLSPMPSYREGESDGGPGKWVADSRHYPRVPEDAAYQQQATSAPPGMEYQVKVPTALMPLGRKSFDSYDPSTGNLIDAKRYVDWPKEELDFSMKAVAKDLKAEADVADYFGRKLELRVATPEKADILRKIIEGNSSTNVVIVVVPAK